jgi:N-terminal domain of reverse transcriptase
MTGYSFTTPVWAGGLWVAPAIAEARAAPRANGPEDPPRDVPGQWDKADWPGQEERVRRLRQRIFKATREQDWPRVRNLQTKLIGVSFVALRISEG